MPTITDVAGDVTHGNSITITGTGFGTKATAAPAIWDNASGPTDPTDLWDVARPRAADTSDTTLQTLRRDAPFHGVSAPHSRVVRFLAGSHGGGGDVALVHNLTVTTPIDLRVYASCWMRGDPAWFFNPNTDNNFKMFHWADVGIPYNNTANINYEFNPRPEDFNPTFKGWHLYNGHPTTAMLDGQSIFAGTPDVHNPMTGWMKYEIISHYNSAGFTRIRENGRSVVGFSGDVDSFNATTRIFSFGGFARVQNSNNYRYFTDLYLDTTHQRVLLANAPTLNSSATIREVQIPTAWADTSITVTVNRGVFADDDTVFLFVVDAANVASDGLEIEPPPADAPPVITSALSVGVEVGATDPYQIVATNSPTSFTASPLPSGRSINTSTGEITGTYDTVGQTQTIIEAINSFGTDQETVTFDVAQAPATIIEDPVIIGTNANKTGTTLSVTVQELVPSGNTIFVVASTKDGSTTTGLPTCRDNVNGPNYIRDILEMTESGATKFAMFRFSDNAELSVGSVITLTIGDAISAAKSMTAFWVRGLNTFEPLDVLSSAAATAAGTAPNSGPVTTT